VSSAGRPLRGRATSRNSSLPVSATECAASAASALDPLTIAAPALATAMSRFTASATTTVRRLSPSWTSAIAVPLRSVVRQLAGRELDVEPVVPGRERAGPPAVVGAGWVVEVVEVQPDPVGGQHLKAPAVGTLHGVGEVAPAAVGAPTAGRVPDRQEQPAALRGPPPQCQRAPPPGAVPPALCSCP